MLNERIALTLNTEAKQSCKEQRKTSIKLLREINRINRN